MKTRLRAALFAILAGALASFLLSNRDPLDWIRNRPALTSSVPSHEQSEPDRLADIRSLRSPVSFQSATGFARFNVGRSVEHSPGWAIEYGKEFWKRDAAKSAAVAGGGHADRMNAEHQLDLGAVIDRVSHSAQISQAGSGANSEPSWTARVDAAAYSAVFGPSAIELALPPAQSSEPLTQSPGGRFGRDDWLKAYYRTKSIQVGFDRLTHDHPSDAPWSIVGNTVQRLLVPSPRLVEHYETTSAGISLTWIVGERIPRPGALHIETELTGLAYGGTTDQGHHFADASGACRLRVGHVTVVDHRGQTWKVPTSVRRDGLRVSVAEDILAQASYPLAIDPLISPEFGMDNPIFNPEAARQQAPGIASNGTLFLVVWADRRFATLDDNINTTLYAVRISSTGAVLDPFGIPLNSGAYSGSPTVASDGGDFLVVWEHDPWRESDIVGTRVTRDGKVLQRDGFLISPGRGQRQFDPIIASNGRNYFVLWKDTRTGQDGDLYAIRVANSGVVLDPLAFPVSVGPSVPSAPAVTAHGDNYLVIWSNLNGGINLYGTVVTGDGEVREPNGRRLPGTYRVTNASIASNGNFALIVWSGTNISGVRVDANLRQMETIPLRLNSSIGSKENAKVCSIGREFFVVWRQASEIRGTRVHEDGSVTPVTGLGVNSSAGTGTGLAVASVEQSRLVVWLEDPQPGGVGKLRGSVITPAEQPSNAFAIPTFPPANQQIKPSVAFNGANYLVVWTDHRKLEVDTAPLYRTYGARVTARGEVMDPNGIAITESAVGHLAPEVASNGQDYFVVWNKPHPWRAEGRAILGARVTHTGTVLDEIPLDMGTGRLSPKVASDGTDYFVVWAGAELIYGTRVSNQGVVATPNGHSLVPAASRVTALSVASSGLSYFVVWESSIGQRFDPDAATDLRGVRIRSDESIASSPPVLIARKKFSQVLVGEQLFPFVASNGNGYLVVWQDPIYSGKQSSGLPSYNWRIMAVALSEAGMPFSTNAVRVSSAETDQRRPSAASDGRDYLIVWQDDRNYSTRGIDVFGRLLDETAFPIDTSEFPINPGLGHEELAKVIGRGLGRFFVVTQAIRDESHRIVGSFVTRESITFENGSPVLFWLAQPGKQYRIEFKDAIDSSRWMSLEPGITATQDAVIRVDDTAQRAAQKFYRVVQLP